MTDTQPFLAVQIGLTRSELAAVTTYPALEQLLAEKFAEAATVLQRALHQGMHICFALPELSPQAAD